LLLFQSLILLTGNYNFFNLLSMLICVFLFDDAALRRALPMRLASWVQRRAPNPGRATTAIATALAFVIVPVGVNGISKTLTHTALPVADALADLVSPLEIVNRYGLFAIMTTTRPEIVIEGSSDGQTWREYVFRYKPGPLTRQVPWTLPHQPRLDWQMWFAALGNYRQNPWFVSLMLRLLEGSPSVVALLDANPFPEGPPKFVRARLYDYRFADEPTHAATGDWWVRQAAGWYFPKVSLADFARAGAPR
jgi:hypothetical protein